MRLIWGLPLSEGLGGEMLVLASLFFDNCILERETWAAVCRCLIALLRLGLEETLAVTFYEKVTLDGFLTVRV